MPEGVILTQNFPKLGLSQGITCYLGYLWPREISNRMASQSNSWAVKKGWILRNNSKKRKIYLRKKVVKI